MLSVTWFRFSICVWNVIHLAKDASVDSSLNDPIISYQEVENGAGCPEKKKSTEQDKQEVMWNLDAAEDVFYSINRTEALGHSVWLAAFISENSCFSPCITQQHGKGHSLHQSKAVVWEQHK